VLELPHHTEGNVSSCLFEYGCFFVWLLGVMDVVVIERIEEVSHPFSLSAFSVSTTNFKYPSSLIFPFVDSQKHFLAIGTSFASVCC
jgi:hypothetical protein